MLNLKFYVKNSKLWLCIFQIKYPEWLHHQKHQVLIVFILSMIKKVYKYTLDNFVLNWIDMGIIAIFSVYGAFIGKTPIEVFWFAYF